MSSDPSIPAPHPQQTQTQTQNERFFHHFQDAVSTLRTQLSALASIPADQRPEAIDACLTGIAQLSQDVRDAGGYIPAYDLKSCSETLKSLTNELQTTRASFAPRTKFSFKNRLKANPIQEKNEASTATTPPTSAEAPSTPKIPEDDTPHPPLPPGTPNTIHRPSFPSTNILITNHSSIHLIATSSSSTSSGTLRNISRSIIDLSALTFSTLNLKTITTSILTFGPVAGPIHLTGLTNCVLRVTCRQFRMHECRAVDVYLDVGSRPIIEDCRGVRFAPLPRGSGEENLWEQVDDFKWLRPEHSPNWCVLPVAKRVGEGLWENLRGERDSGGLDGILGKIDVVRRGLE
ncbi:TBCC-domain-containing protein [Patellaria atrata CBS 101060]|uniref:TBCC-domain-containing protein n=1 Tax=Patellaria atrata CBS 101060 TaxID=1346257 RepID=A0A9P4VSI6_9PEZI|nr:TBCC-domain-containing protein [Patellaria atrata CBS 101060]